MKSGWKSAFVVAHFPPHENSRIFRNMAVFLFGSKSVALARAHTRTVQCVTESTGWHTLLRWIVCYVVRRRVAMPSIYTCSVCIPIYANGITCLTAESQLCHYSKRRHIV